jgi:hypothetical protein
VTSRRAAILLGVCVLAAALWHLVIEPARADGARAAAALESTRVRLQEGQAAARRLAIRTLETGALDQILRHQVGRLEQNADSGLVLATLTTLAGAENVQVTHFKPRPEVDRGGSRASAADVIVRGGFHDVVRLLDTMTAVPPVVGVSNLRVAAHSEEGGPGSVTTSFVLSTFASVSAIARTAADASETGIGPLLYADEGRRDPFLAPDRPVRGKSGERRARGLAGVRSNEVVVRGIVRNGAQTLAILETAAGQSFLVRPGDRLADASVTRIDGGGAVLSPSDGLASVRKPLAAPAGPRR